MEALADLLRHQLSASMGALDVYLEHLAWEDLEAAYREARTVLERFAPLGPQHAALAARFPATAALAVTYEAGSDLQRGLPPAHFFTRAQDCLKGAIWSAVYDPPGGLAFALRERDMWRLEALLTEGADRDPEEHHRQRACLRRGLRRAWPRIWSHLGSSRPAPPLRLDERFGLPGLRSRGLGVVDGTYGPAGSPRARLALSLPTLGLATLSWAHRLPELSGLGTAAARWEPCALFSHGGGNALGVLIHEGVHAVATRRIDAYDPQGRHAWLTPVIARLEQGPAALRQHGLVLSPLPSLVDQRAPDLTFSNRALDEAYTEAAGQEVYAALEDELNPSLTALRGENIWATLTNIAAPGYGTGLPVVARLQTGESALRLLTSPDPQAALAERLAALNGVGPSFRDALLEQPDPIFDFSRAEVAAEQRFDVVFAEWHRLLGL